VKVSGILPTRGRSEWAQQAVECFLAQDYPDKELVIADDGDDPSFNYSALSNLFFGHYPVLYFILDQRMSIPLKRNYLVGKANGEYIAHFDSDDWSDPGRLSDQLDRLEDSGKAVTGYREMLFFDEARQKLGVYRGDSNYVLGTSLMYRREWAIAHPFSPELAVGEDNNFVFVAAFENQLVTALGRGLQVARVHPGNTSGKDVDYYTGLPLSHLPIGFPCNRQDFAKL
jgi:glycosyltransferase involved in cell wall biosynthesis